MVVGSKIRKRLIVFIITVSSFVFLFPALSGIFSAAAASETPDNVRIIASSGEGAVVTNEPVESGEDGVALVMQIKRLATAPDSFGFAFSSTQTAGFSVDWSKDGTASVTGQTDAVVSYVKDATVGFAGNFNEGHIIRACFVPAENFFELAVRYPDKPYKTLFTVAGLELPETGYFSFLLGGGETLLEVSEISVVTNQNGSSVKTDLGMRTKDITFAGNETVALPGNEAEVPNAAKGGFVANSESMVLPKGSRAELTFKVDTFDSKTQTLAFGLGYLNGMDTLSSKLGGTSVRYGGTGCETVVDGNDPLFGKLPDNLRGFYSGKLFKSYIRSRRTVLRTVAKEERRGGFYAAP